MSQDNAQDTRQCERDSLTPREFAARHDKSITWGYRQIYAGKIRVMDTAGTIRIPMAEVQRFASRAVVWKGRKGGLK